MHEADIKLCVLTGDKLETAESIGYSCKLLTPDMDIIKCRSKEDVDKNFNKEKAHLNETLCILGKRRALIMEHDAVQYVLNDKSYKIKRWFLKMSVTFESIICCRVSPS